VASYVAASDLDKLNGTILVSGLFVSLLLKED